MGFAEMCVILVVAFLVVGPAKMVEMAKWAGKTISEARRAIDEGINS